MRLNSIKSLLFRKESLLHLLFWLFFLSMLHIDWSDNWLDRSLRPNTPAPISAVLFPLFFYLNAFWLVPRYLHGPKWYRYFLISFLIVFAVEILRSTIFALSFPKAASFFTSLSFELLSRENLVLGMPNSMFFAFVFSLAYRFTKDRISNTKTIQELRQEKIALELSVLKAQTNPHFLFNNLNVLDDLIERDKEEAKAYLHKLANIYRYWLGQTEQDVVSLEEEWKFVDDYIYLLEKRFNRVYVFEKINELKNLKDYLIPPTSIQGLVENVVKHNQAQADDPLKVEIKADASGISICHEKRPKMKALTSNGTGLKNLAARYKLLADKDILIEDASHFLVRLPLLKKVYG